MLTQVSHFSKVIFDIAATCIRKLELWLDLAALHTVWDRSWNQWKHLVGTKIEVEGTFVQSWSRKRREGWDLVSLDNSSRRGSRFARNDTAVRGLLQHLQRFDQANSHADDVTSAISSLPCTCGGSTSVSPRRTRSAATSMISNNTLHGFLRVP